MQQNATPIWNNFPAVFLYGFQWQPLSLAIILSLLITITGKGLLGWSLFILLFAVLFKYAFVVLQDTAEGNMTAPALNGDVLTGNYHLPLKLYALLVLFGLATVSISNSIGPMGGMVFSLTGLLLFPAAIMLLAVTESFMNAISPALLLRLVIDIRWSYLALFGLLYMLQAAQANLANLLAGILIKILIPPTMLFLTVYFTILTFHIMGYILYQNHKILGHKVAQPTDGNDLQDPRLAHFEAMMELGKHEAAIGELIGLLKEQPNDLDLNRRLHQLLVLEQQDDKLKRHSSRYLPLLLTQSQDTKALEVFQDYQRMGVTCAMNEAQSYYQLAQALSLSGQYKTMVNLLNGLHNRFPNSEVIAPAYLLTARTLCEALNRDELAIKTLKFVLKRYPQHPLITEVQSYLDTVEQLTP